MSVTEDRSATGPTPPAAPPAAVPATDATRTDATRTDTTGTDDVPSAEEIAELRLEIDHLDSEILRLIKRRTEVSKRIGVARMAAGGPRIVYSREMTVLQRFRDLGPEGRELAMMLLRLGRGRLGTR